VLAAFAFLLFLNILPERDGNALVEAGNKSTAGPLQYGSN